MKKKWEIIRDVRASFRAGKGQRGGEAASRLRGFALGGASLPNAC
jgi:hypothetical protein